MKPVLYVEDLPDDVLFMQHVWERAGIAHPLIDVSDGQQAIDYLDGNEQFKDRKKYPLPCLVLLDLNLPRKSGFEVLDWIRNDPRFKSLKVVIVSGSNQDEDMERAQSLGITDYVVKPSGLERLYRVVVDNKERWLGKG